MRTWVVTSAVTFVPHNYNEMILPLASSSDVEGLIVLENRSIRLLLQAFFLIVSGAGPRLGWQLFKNFFSSSNKKRQEAYTQAGKQVVFFPDINSPECVQFLKQQKPDLLLNARTRSYFRKDVLQIPRLGCLNVHHGLLPDQRGLMCDFWAHLENTSAGFSVHVMTPRLDDGDILLVNQVSREDQNYLHFLLEASRQEGQMLQELLTAINHADSIRGQKNLKTSQTLYRKNPGLKDFYRLKSRGVKI